MTKRQVEECSRFLDKWRERLRLQHYGFDYFYYPGRELPAEHAGADSLGGAVYVRPEIEEAEIHLVADRSDAPPEFYGRHEMLHVMMAPMRQALGMLEDQVSPVVFELAKQAFKEAEEQAVRRLDDAFEEFEPLLPGKD